MKIIATYLERIALLCWTSPKYRHILFSLLTIFILCTYGYYFGTFDQASHIPFLKKNVDPSLFPNDHYFDLRNSHYSYFWLLFVPFYKLGILEIVAFIVYVLSTYLTFWAFWKLSKTLFHNPLTSLIATLAIIIPHIGFSGFPLFEFSMLNRTVLLPFELIAFRYYLKRNYAGTFLILGILYNFHALSVHFVLAMLGTDMLISLVKKRDIRPFLSTPLFILTALPVLVWKFSHSGVQVGPHREWFTILNSSIFFHLFNFFSLHNPIVLALTVGGGSSLILFFIAKKKIPNNDIHERVSHFMYGGIFVILVQFFATLFFPLTIVIQAQIFRIGTFLSIFAYLYMSQMISTIRKTTNHFICFMTALFLSFSPFILLISLLCWRATQIRVFKVTIASLIILYIIILSVFLALNVVRPGIHIWPEKTTFYDVQMWAKNNTPRSALFLTPPAKWWLYDVEWRVISERSSVSTLSELLEGAFDPSYIQYWKPRFEDVAPHALKQFRGNYLDNIKIANNAYYTHTTESFIALGKKYGASYVVVDRPHSYNLPIAYQNEEYTVYSLMDL